ncbi:MAG: hypothetical protein IJU45_08295 [Clostridia bacterium]|nr:hypothetical protein [Clostridia bacterium]
MSKFLIISEEFLNRENANTHCLMEVINGLNKNGHEIIVLSRDFDSKNLETIKGVEVHKFTINLHRFADSLLWMKDKNPLFRYVFLIISYVLNHLEAFLLKRKMISAGNTIIKNISIDAVLSVFQTIINHDVAYRLKLKNKGVKWIMYNVDQMTFNSTNTPKRTAKYRAEESRFSKAVDKMINVEGIEEEYINNNFDIYKDVPKIEVALPNLKPDEANFDKQNDNSATVLRYFGRFYKDIRNPDCLIRMIKDLDPERYVVEFYGQSCEYLKKNYGDLPACAVLKGTVSSEKCIELTDSADILINIGNTCTNQMPSKVFEYIGSGKPILNVYFTEKELAMKYLKKYPCILNVKADENISSSQLDEFCRNSRLIPTEEIKEIYFDALSENVIEKTVKFIES